MIGLGMAKLPSADFSISEIKSASPSLVDVASRRVALKRKSARELVGLCPFHAERSPSFYVYGINKEVGQQKFCCFGCGAKGDVIDFICRAEGKVPGDVIKELAELSGLKKGRFGQPGPVKLDSIAHLPPLEMPLPDLISYEIVIPSPAHALPLARQGDRRTSDILVPKADVGDRVRMKLNIERLHRFKDFDNNDIGYVVRTPPGRSGKKATPQVAWARNVKLADGTVAEGWAFVSFPSPRIPYGAHLLGAEERKLSPFCVLLVEGEKCQEEAARLLSGRGIVVLSWVGGGKAWNRTDWSRIAQLPVVLWPDHDAPGRSTMEEIGRHLSTLGCPDLRWVEPDAEKEKGWDVADAVLNDSWDAQRLEDVVRGAVPWLPSQPDPDGGSTDGDDLPAERVGDDLEERSDVLLSHLSDNPRAAHGQEAMGIFAEIRVRDFGLWTDLKAKLKAIGILDIRVLDQRVAALSKRLIADGKIRDPTIQGLAAPGEGEISGYDVRALGYDKATYYYYSPATRQVVEIKARDHKNAATMFQLAPRSWWASRFTDGRGGVDWEEAGNAMMQSCHAQKVYDPDLVRGRGAWFDQDSIVVHLGESLMVDGQPTPLSTYNGPYVYERSRPITPPDSSPLSHIEAEVVEQICRHIRWREGDDLSPMLLAGWIVLAPVCGALRWRSHIWLTGGAGSGKSWLMANIVEPLVGHIAVTCQSSTTEAGIRHALSSDARPILFDEAENEDEQAQRRIRQVLELMRQASSENGAPILKGTSDQSGRRYTIRSMFALSSIVVAARQQADLGRIGVLEVADPPPSPTKAQQEADDARWENLQDLVHRHITPQFASRLFARTVRQLHVIRANIDTCSRVVARVTGSQRTGDQIGTLIGGCLSLSRDVPITSEEAMEIIGKLRGLSSTGVNTEDRDEWRLWGHLLAHKVRVYSADGTHSSERRLGELMQIAAGCGEAGSGMTLEAASLALRKSGIKIDGAALYISNNHRDISEALGGTPWQVGWHKLLERLPGGQRSPTSVYFHGGHQQRAVELPASLIAPSQDMLAP
jgi:putative DNA primase/helicase